VGIVHVELVPEIAKSIHKLFFVKRWFLIVESHFSVDDMGDFMHEREVLSRRVEGAFDPDGLGFVVNFAVVFEVWRFL